MKILHKIKWKEIFRKAGLFVRLLVVIGVISEPVLLPIQAYAVQINVSSTYDVITGLTSGSVNAGGTVTGFSHQGVPATLNLIQGGWVESAPNCITIANEIQAGTVPGTVTCNNPNPPAACITIPSGAQACSALMGASPITGIDANCQDVSVATTSTLIDTCSQYAQDPTCTQTSSNCINTNSITGACASYDKTYSCVDNTNATTGTAGAGGPTGGTMTCPGSTDCSDGSCINTTSESNPNFGKAMAMQNVAQQMQSNGSCDPITGTCTVFSGDFGFCKIWPWVGTNCCKEADAATPAPDMANYIKLVQKMSTLNNSIGMLSATGTTPVVGAWQAMGSPGAATWDAVTKTFTSSWNSIAKGTALEINTTATKSVVVTATNALMVSAAKFTAQVFGQSAANLLFTAAPAAGSTAVTGGSAIAANGGLTSAAASNGVILNPAIATPLGWIMIAYTVYQIAMILIAIIFKCSQPQYEWSMKKKMLTAHVIGQYCANKIKFLGCERYEQTGCSFATPLARIIQEQVRPQLGISWGTPAAPNCRGLTTTELSQVDWSLVDLSEWINILKSTGNLPGPGTLDLNSATGAGSNLATSIPGSQLNTQQRIQDKLQGVDVNNINNTLSNTMW